MSQTCIFCKINNKEIPSFTIYEDAYFRVILDRFPAAKGHMLVITKAHYEDIFSLPGEIAEKVYPIVKHMAEQLKVKLGAEGVNVVQNNGHAAGQEVYHSHIHLIPRYTGDGVILNKTSHSDTTIEELKEVAERLNA